MGPPYARRVIAARAAGRSGANSSASDRRNGTVAPAVSHAPTIASPRATLRIDSTRSGPNIRPSLYAARRTGRASPTASPAAGAARSVTAATSGYAPMRKGTPQNPVPGCT